MTPWTDLGGGVFVRQSRVLWMNSLLLLHREHAVLVDPGVLPSELDDLADAVRTAGPKTVSIVFTHSHWDHVLGRPWWPQAVTVGHAWLGDELRRDAAAILAGATEHAARFGETWSRGFQPFEPDLVVNDGYVRSRDERETVLGPWRLMLREARGHCDSQITVDLEERRLLFAADLLSDREIPWLDRNPAYYRHTLTQIATRTGFGQIDTLVPGHGSIARDGEEAHERVRRDLHYLDTMEIGVRKAYRAGRSIEETQAQLAAMDYLGKGAAYPMDEVHRENVRITWETVAHELA
jgi:hydroxyacylglutathione hydrolase